MNAISRIFALSALLLPLAIGADEAKPVAQTGKARRFLAAGFEHGQPQPNQVAIIGLDGKIEWSIKANNVHDAWLLPNGNILYQNDQRIAEVTREKQEVWSYDSRKMNGNEGKPVTIHAFQRLADGLTMIVESGPARIIEVDKDGKIVHQLPLTVDKPNPGRDSRNARKLASGNYLVCHEGDGKVREYDPTGKVVWTHETKTMVYGAIRLANGNTLIATGNGNRVIEVTPEHKEVWTIEKNELPGITLGWMTQLERLPNGNTIVVNCHAGPKNPQAFEITPDKKVVWTYNNWVDFGHCTPVFQTLDETPGVIR